MMNKIMKNINKNPRYKIEITMFYYVIIIELSNWHSLQFAYCSQTIVKTIDKYNLYLVKIYHHEYHS